MKSSIEELLADYLAGKMIILLDDESRENEGDLVIAANKISANAINFMVTHGRGLVCLTLSEARCKQLNLPLMVHNNQTNFSTNFTISIEASSGVTSGISAADRATTIKAAIAKGAKPSDIVQPGHIFPVMARNGGVLTRAGHTEAGCDFASLVGFEPSSVIVEILNEDGSMARYDDLVHFSQKHNIKLGTIEDLIRYRLKTEKTIQKITQKPFKNAYGNWTLTVFRDVIGDEIHLSLSKGKIDKNNPTLVRVHMQNTLDDVLLSADKKIPINKALVKIAKAKSGVLLLLRKENNTQLLDHIDKTINYQDSDDIKTFGIGAQILNELGVGKMRILGGPRKLNALKGFDLEIVDYENC